MEEKLPKDIILDILLRLPYQSIINCKLVCKPWRDLLRHIKLDLLFLVTLELDRVKTLKDLQLLYHGGQQYDDIDIHGSYSCKTLANFDKHPTAPGGPWSTTIGSCNGLVCFSDHHDSVDDPTHICNPITGEYVNLPKYILLDEDYVICNLRRRRPLGCYFISGFGYNYSTDEYKVVRMYKRFGASSGLKVQVYTLGSSLGWRDRGRENFSISSTYGAGVCANGALHWIERHNRKIVAFDLADEKFLFIPLPLIYSGKYIGCFNLVLLGGYLSVIDEDREGKDGKFVNIWSLKKKKRCNNYEMGEDEFDNYWGWNKEFSIPSDGSAYGPFAVTKSNQVLLWFDEFLCFYDSKTKTITKLWEMDSSWSSGKVTLHLNSLVSLVLGEKSKKSV